MPTAQLIHDNIATLHQAETVLSAVSRVGLDFGAQIGPHLRHVLDHYDCFLSGLDAGCIDYDRRQRDLETETDPAAARQRITSIAAQLRQLEQRSWAPRLQVRLATDADSATQETCSSPARELQFLQSHAVHHYALIRLILQSQGLTLGEEFGKAPSTLRFERISA